jgi:hypothetical protein
LNGNCCTNSRLSQEKKHKTGQNYFEPGSGSLSSAAIAPIVDKTAKTNIRHIQITTGFPAAIPLLRLSIAENIV